MPAPPAAPPAPPDADTALVAPAGDRAVAGEVPATEEALPVHPAPPAELLPGTAAAAADAAAGAPERLADEADVVADAVEPAVSSPPERGLATILGGPPLAGRPTWLDVPPERVGPLLALFADEGARLLAMTVLLPAAAAVAASPAAIALRYHFVVNEAPITMSTQTPPRSAPSAASVFPAMIWRERELAGEYGLRFVEPSLAAADAGSGGAEQGVGSADPADPAPDALILRPQSPDP